MKARHFASSLGRFPQPDSFAFASLTNPQSLNLYGYVLNNPLRQLRSHGWPPVTPPLEAGSNAKGR